MKRGKKITGIATCLDDESGLYHPEHFQHCLQDEMVRLEVRARPLALVVADFDGSNGLEWQELGRLLKTILKRLEVAAKLGSHQMAILLPGSGPARAAELVEKLAVGLKAGSRTVPPRFGVALARPGDDPLEDLLIRASEKLDLAEAVLEYINERKHRFNVETALVAAEKELLFAGFSYLGHDGSVTDKS